LFNGRTNKSNARFTCPNCCIVSPSSQDSRESAGKVIKGAKGLPRCKMSDDIETGLFNCLDSAYSARSIELGVPLDTIEKAEGLCVRVLSNVEKKNLVGERMLQRYKCKGYASEFQLRSKCIALFQQIHGVDVLLFAMYVYEYGDDCPAPNRRQVYISYLDSVRYFEPKCYRTTAYHSIIVEYLRYVKKRGFHTASIWSCPPVNGDDYIFYCHPKHQLVPREDMLRTWYHKMLDQAKAQGIVLSVSTLYDEYFSVESDSSSVNEQRRYPTCLPYFEGDYIPGELEIIIQQCEANGDKASDSSLHDTVMFRLGQNLFKMKDNFIVVHLRNRRFVEAVQRGDNVSHWKEDSDDDMVRNKRAKISAKSSPESDTGKIELSSPLNLEEQNDVLAPSGSSKNVEAAKSQDDGEISNIVKQEKDDSLASENNVEGSDELKKDVDIVKANKNPDFTDNRGDDGKDGGEGNTVLASELNFDTEEKLIEKINSEGSCDDHLSNEKVLKYQQGSILTSGGKDENKGKSINNDKESQDYKNSVRKVHLDSASDETVDKAVEVVKDMSAIHKCSDSSIPPQIINQDVSTGLVTVDSGDKISDLTDVQYPSARANETCANAEGQEPDIATKTLDASTLCSTGVVKIFNVDAVETSKTKYPVDSTNNNLDNDATAVKKPDAAIMPSDEQQIATDLTLIKKRAIDDVIPAINSHFSDVANAIATVKTTMDEDPPMESEMFESRQQFLNYCQSAHCQFDELRRAKHSTVMVLFQLHNPTAPKFLQQCGACYRDITHGIRHHCNACSNFDLCADCYEPILAGTWAKRDPRFAHDQTHTFTAIDMELIDDTPKNRADRQDSLVAHVKLLEHAAFCEGPPSCSLHNCDRLKKIFLHCSTCNVRPKRNCKICVRILVLCTMHSRLCNSRGICPVPFCDRIRERNKRLHRQQQLMDDRRRQAQNELYHAGDT
jgi:Histone acetylation protein/TAZ zinc finger/Zinc finger, ZZ type